MEDRAYCREHDIYTCPLHANTEHCPECGGTGWVDQPIRPYGAPSITRCTQCEPPYQEAGQ